MPCSSCNRYSHRGPGICDSCKSIQEYNKPGVQPGAFKPQWQIEAEQMQRQEAQRRLEMAEQERREMERMQRMLGGVGLDMDQMYRRMQGRGMYGPKPKKYEGKPKKVMIMKIV